MNNQTSHDPFSIIRCILIELATVVDNYYDDDMSEAIEPTVKLITAGSERLTRGGLLVPDCVRHTLERFPANNDLKQSSLNDQALIIGLVTELSTEIDLHFEDEIANEVQGSIALIAETLSYLHDEGLPAPDSATHVLRRFGGTRH